MNIGDAYSKGVETEMDALITRHVEAQLDYTYDQTKITSLNPLFVSPNVSAPPPGLGTALPGTPRNSAALTLRSTGTFSSMRGAVCLDQWTLPKQYPACAFVNCADCQWLRDGQCARRLRRSALEHGFVREQPHEQSGYHVLQDPAIFGNRAQAIVSQPRTFGLTVGYSYK